MNCHTWGGRSCSSRVIRHSSSIAHSSSTGPSRKAFSSAASLGLGNASSLLQFGLPPNSSASHHTVPASSASCSVCEIGGRILRKIFSRRLEMRMRRTCGTKMMTLATKISVRSRDEIKVIFLGRFVTPVKTRLYILVRLLSRQPEGERRGHSSCYPLSSLLQPSM